MKKLRHLTSTLAAAMALAAGTTAMAQFAPLPLTSSSYTYDIVVESNFAYKVSQDCVTATMDAGPALGGNTWYEIGLDKAYPTTGLPHAGTVLTSVTQSDHSYQLAPSWFSNNAVFVGPYDTNVDMQGPGFNTAGINLTTPAAYTGLSVLTSAGNGPVGLTVAVYHADGSTDSGVSALTVPDWFDSPSDASNQSPAVILAYVAGGRVTPVNGGFNSVPSSNQMSLWSVDLPLANATSPVTNITFTYASGGRCAVFALSGSTAAGGVGPYTPIAFSATNFNADIVVEAQTTQPFTATMDNGTNVLGTNGSTGNTWFESGYVLSGPLASPVAVTTVTNGVPAAGSTFTSASYPSKYQMAASYAAPNAILINSNITSATLTPTTPTNAAVLCFLTSGANIGGGTMTNLCIVAHKDGTIETNFMFIYDWFNGTALPAWIASGRVQFDNGRELNNFNSGDPRLFDSVVFLKDSTSPVTNITIQYYNPVGSNGSSWNSYVLAVSASTNAPVVATLPPFALSDLGGTTTLGPPFVLGSGNITYQWFNGATAIANATNATYITPTTLAVGSNQYSVKIANAVASTNLPITVLVGSSLLYNSSFWTINNNATGFVTDPYIATNIFEPTDNHGSEASSAFLNSPVPVNGFTAAWTYRDVTTGGADGTSFILQNDPRGTTALGGGGGSIGVAGITPSAEIDFDIYSGNAPLGGNNGGVQFQTGGTAPTPLTGAAPYSSVAPIVWGGGDSINVIVNYDQSAGTLQLTEIDTVNSAVFTTNWTVGDLTSVVGGTTAYVGFSAGTGGAQATQTISNFFYIPAQATLAAAISPPTFAAAVDQPVTFTAVPLGSPPYTFQWSFNGTAIAGATNLTFTTNAVTADAGTYSVLVGSGNLTATADATLTVSPSVLTIFPVTNAPIFAGTDKTFTVSAYGQPPLTYQWFNGDTAIKGATNASYTPTNLVPGTYTLSVAVSNATSYSEPTVAVTVVPATPFSTALLAYNPLSYWPLNETNGTTAYDYIGNNDGTYTGGYTQGLPGLPGPGFGVGNYSAGFDGFTAYVDIPVGNLNITNSITVMLMLQAGAPALSFSSPFDHTDEAWRIDYDTSGFAHFADGNGTGDSDATGSKNIGDGNWHMITGVYNGTNGQCALYVDGLFVTSHTNETPAVGSQSDVWIGGAPDYATGSPNRDFGGNLADAVVIPSALDASQVQALYQAADFPPTVTVVSNTFEGDLGGSVTLTASTNGTPPLSFQWYSLNSGNGQTSPLAGQTNLTLTLSNLAVSQNGLEYFVMVTNLYGSANNSNAPATLSVESGAPVITVDVAPLSLIAGLGSDQTFDVTAFGTAPLVYQWYENGEVIPSATNSSYMFTVPAGTNTYYVKV
ncbi:MAG: lectin-like domain-containing protein, partial [Limisphaerales bacterium]